jgi:replication factor C small subunit
MLWIEKYRPVRLDGIIGQEAAIGLLRSFARTRNVPHLLLTGPHGTGKSCTVEAFARELYGDGWEANTTIIPTGDLFEQGKAYLEADERYAHLYRKDQSFITNFKNIIRTYASLLPLDAGFKLMVFEDAGVLTRDAQQALRRIMERYSATCRFILCTTNQSAIIPAISSRCLPLFFAPLKREEVSRTLSGILEKEGKKEAISDDERELLVQESRGDLRKAIMLLQVRATSGRSSDLAEISGSETTEIVQAAFHAMKSGEIAAAAKKIEALMIEYGLSGTGVIAELRAVVKREYNDPRIPCALADAEYRLGHANNEFVQLNALVAKIAEEIFG